MGVHLTTFEGSVTAAIENAIKKAIPDAAVEVAGSGGHFTIAVTSTAFADKKMIDSHRMVLSAIAPLMAGDSAPVHAVDKLTTRSP